MSAAAEYCCPLARFDLGVHVPLYHLSREWRERPFVEAHAGARHLGRPNAAVLHFLGRLEIGVESESMLLEIDRPGRRAKQVRGELVAVVAARVQAGAVRHLERAQGGADAAVG